MSATEKLSARWVWIWGMLSQTPDHSPGTGSPYTERPTGWDGGPCIAKSEIDIGGGQIGQFSMECTADYDVVADQFPLAARYDAYFFELGRTAPLYNMSRPRSPLHATFSGPEAVSDLLPGPNLIDRINVSAWDGNGHLLATGHVCAHGCVGLGRQVTGAQPYI